VYLIVFADQKLVGFTIDITQTEFKKKKVIRLTIIPLIDAYGTMQFLTSYVSKIRAWGDTCGELLKFGIQTSKNFQGSPNQGSHGPPSANTLILQRLRHATIFDPFQIQYTAIISAFWGYSLPISVVSGLLMVWTLIYP
jgi:hypothetical protein